jgi:hypothetical protein
MFNGSCLLNIFTKKSSDYLIFTHEKVANLMKYNNSIFHCSSINCPTPFMTLQLTPFLSNSHSFFLNFLINTSTFAKYKNYLKIHVKLSFRKLINYLTMDYQTSLRTMVVRLFFWQNFTIFWTKFLRNFSKKKNYTQIQLNL